MHQNGFVYVVYRSSLAKVDPDWQDGKLTLDDNWGPIPYLRPGQSTAPAAAVVGDWVAMHTNAVPSDTPLSIVAMRQSDAKVSNLQPFASDMKKRSKSFLPSMVTADPDNSRIYAMDAGIGKVGGFSLDQKTGEMKTLWTQGQRTLNSAATGEQLGRSGQLPKMTSEALVTPGDNGRIYYLGLAGQIYRVSVEPTD